MARGQLRFETEGESDDSDGDELGEALAAFGLSAESPDDLDLDEDFYLYPENEETLWLWMAVQTQWLVSDGVRLSLNYPGVEVVFRMQGIGKKEQGRHFSLLQLMERECLNEWARNRK